MSNTNQKMSFRQCLQEGLLLMAVANTRGVCDYQLLKQLKDELH